MYFPRTDFNNEDSENEMKKILYLALALAVSVPLISGCGAEKKSGPQVNCTAEYYESFNYSNHLDDDGRFSDIRALDFVTPGEYMGMKIPSDVSTVTDESIRSEINTLLKKYAEDEKIFDRETADGDTVNISYIGRIDGEAFEGGTTGDEGAEVTIGETDYIDNFIEQLKGHMPGDHFDVNVTFPEDYEEVGEDEFTVNGKPAVFEVTINFIVGERNVLPELTDQFVTEHFSRQYKWNTVDGMKKGIRKLLLDQAVSSYIQNRLLTDCTVSEVPEVFYIYQAESMLAYYDRAAKQNDMNFENYLGKTMQEMLSENEENNRKQAKLSLIIQAIGEENLELIPTDGAIKDFFSEYYTDDELSSMYERYGRGYLAMLTLNENVLNFIRDNAAYEDAGLSPGE